MATRFQIERDNKIAHKQALEDQGYDPYPSHSHKSHSNQDIITKYDTLEDQEVTLAGRIMSIRDHKRLMFIDLADQSAKVQLYILETELASSDPKEQVIGFDNIPLLDTGDFIQATGTVTRTKRGEISLKTTQIKLLTKSVRPLPTTWNTFKDPEIIFRRRYLDLTMHEFSREMFVRKAHFWKASRQFLEDRGFIEFETPVLEHVTGGADARPFITHMNALDQDFYLRISTELYQKRLIGGMFEKVFVIGPNFRNEGLSDEHLPEYTQIEWYWAYADYRDNMRLLIEMFRYLAQEVWGKTTFTRGEHTFDLADEWVEIDYVKIIKETYNLDIFKSPDSAFQKVLDEHDVKLDGAISRNRLIDNVWKLIRKNISGPAFLVNEPKFMSPLAKSKPDNPQLTERFHIIIAGSELGNGYSELNDPFDQLERFKEQQAARDAGDDESQMMDIDFVEMLEYGMPPCSGYGQSERVFWFLEGVTAREGTLFPALRRKVSPLTQQIYQLNPEEISGNNQDRQDPQFFIAPQVRDKFEGISYAVTTIKNCHIRPKDDQLEALKQEIVTKHTPNLDQIPEIPSIKAYRNIFKQTGVWGMGRRPSSEALLQHLAQGKKLYTVNTAVDAANLAVIKTGISIGIFDARQLKLPITLRFSQKGEPIHLIGDSVPTQTAAGELVYADAHKLLTLDYNYRNIDSAKITLDTSSIILFADGAPGIEAAKLRQALQLAADLISQFTQGKVGDVVLIQ